MKERPIIFSAEMVRAILSGTKTQTRRIVKPQPVYGVVCGLFASWQFIFNGKRLLYPNAKNEIIELCKFGKTGDRLWVRETWAAPHAYDPLPPRLILQDARLHYAATEVRGRLIWRPSIHMPRWASRILLEITDVRVERLQDISEEDAIAEGIEQVEPFFDCKCWKYYGLDAEEDTVCADDPIGSYSSLWESIYGLDSWAANPWVWVISFKRIDGE